MLDKKDLLILSELQDNFPLDPHPYNIIAGRLKLSESEVLRRIESLRRRKVIRYTGAVLDTKKIGLRSSLVALAVPAGRIGPVSRIINKYPQVTHNYLRDGEYNMWFTASAPTESLRAGLVRKIVKETGVEKYLDLSTVKVFKIDARFSLGPQPRVKNNTDIRTKTSAAAKKAQKLPAVRVLSALAQHLDDSREPFASMADMLGIEQRELLQIISMYIRAGLIRRFGAVLDHYKIGLKTNALVAWQTDPKDIPAAAKALSQVRGVSHCYQRKTYPGWPYCVYTMIHARDRRHCREILTLILNAIGDKIKAYRILFTVKELKKTRFDPKQTGRGVYGKKKI